MPKYQFPAAKGCQTGKDYYICAPLGRMGEIFMTDDDDECADFLGIDITVSCLI